MFVNKQFLDFIKNCKEKKLDLAVTSVISTSGSTYTKEGNIMLVNSNEEFIGVLGSKFLQNKVIKSSKEAIDKKFDIEFESIPKDPTSGHGTSKYKTTAFLYKDNYKELDTYIKTPYSILIFGSGAHVESFISISNLMGWETTVIDIDIKKQFVSHADKLIKLEKLEDILNINLDSYNAAVILSHNPKTDDMYLEALLKSNIQYIGLMGNKKNAQKKKDQFNLNKETRFFAPIGLDIGSYTDKSIALSICAQIEAFKNGKYNESRE